MAQRPEDFGRRKRAAQTPKPAKKAGPATDDAPGIPITGRALAIGVVTAGALAASAAHFLQPAPARETCVPTTSSPAVGPTGLPMPALETTSGGAATAGGIGGPDPCPPGTRRSSSSSHYSSSSSGRRSLFWGWSSSSSSSNSGYHAVSSTSTSHATSTAAASSISRGGFGSIGGHFSGGS